MNGEDDGKLTSTKQKYAKIAKVSDQVGKSSFNLGTRTVVVWCGRSEMKKIFKKMQTNVLEWNFRQTPYES